MVDSTLVLSAAWIAASEWEGDRTMAAKDAKAVRALLNELVKYRRNLIVGWFERPTEETIWEAFTRLQSIIDALRKLEKEEKSLS